MTDSPRVPVMVVAGVSSGVGKTTITLGILEALGRRGLTVQAFKVGPDFIDPGFHALATGRPSRNLDGWMCGREHVVDAVARHAADADLAVVEGVMGCFDGCEGASEVGSTAEVAKWLGAPVVLVVDAGAMARSAGALVLGFERFDPDLDLAGVIWNRVGGPLHRRWLSEALTGLCRARALGAVPARPGLALPERHLGLVTAAEGGYTRALREGLAALVEEHVDLDAVVSLASSRIPRSGRAPDPSPVHQVRIGIARDRAFQFYYADNLEALTAAAPSSASSHPWRTRTSRRWTASTSAAATRSSTPRRCRPMSPCAGPWPSSPPRAGPSMRSAAASCTWPSPSMMWTAPPGPWWACSPRRCGCGGGIPFSATGR